MATNPVSRRAAIERRTKAFASFIVGVGLTFLGSLFLMLLFGVLHAEVWRGVPPIGYWLSFLLFLLGDLVVTCMRWRAPERD